MYMSILVYFFIMAVVGNFIFFLRLTWEFLGLESEREGSICWPNNKIIDNDRNSNLEFILVNFNILL